MLEKNGVLLNNTIEKLKWSNCAHQSILPHILLVTLKISAKTKRLNDVKMWGLLKAERLYPVNFVKDEQWQGRLEFASSGIIGQTVVFFKIHN